MILSEGVSMPAVRLDGTVAAVTGAGRGLGFAYAAALAAAGAAVVVNDVDEQVAKEAVSRIEQAGGTAVPYAAAIGGTEAAEGLVNTAVQTFGRLDTLVTNAGILRDKVLWKMSDEEFDAVVQVHLRGTFTCARAAVQHMRDRGAGGRLVLVGSPAGQRGNFGQTNYAAAKAGIAAMVRTWSMECAKAGITVNGIVPVAATAMTATIPAFAPHVQAWEQRGEPLPSWLRAGEGFGTPEDAAGLVVFLASAAAKDVTGQCIGVGGDKLTLWSPPKETTPALCSGGWAAAAIAESWRRPWAGRPRPSVSRR